MIATRIFYSIFSLFFLPLPDVHGITFAPFVDRGRVFRVKAVIDLNFWVDFSSIRENCNDVLQTAKLLRKSRHAGSQFDHFVSHTVKEVTRLCKDLIFSLQRHDLLRISRKKRQLAALGIGALTTFAVEELFHSSSHSAKVEKHNFKVLDREMQNLQTFVQALVTNVETTQSRYNAQIRLLQIQTFIQGTRSEIQTLSSGYIDLIQGNLSPSILPVSQGKEELVNVNKIAATFKAHLPFKDVLSLYSFPVSHEIEGESVRFSIKLPLVDRVYTNWRFLHAPMQIDHFSEPIFVTPEPRKFSLAVPESGTPIALSQADLDHCTKWSGDHFCTYLPTGRKDDACLVSLYHDPSEVMTTCNFSIPYFPVYVLTHLNGNEFLLSLNISSLSYESICRNGSDTFGTYSRGQTLIRLENGCSISTKLFDIPSFTPVQRSVRVRPFTPTLDVSKFNQNVTTLSPEFSLLQHQVLMKIEKNDSPWSHWPFHFGTIVIVLAIVVIILIVIRCFRPKPSST